jgi:hypothetical protein
MKHSILLVLLAALSINTQAAFYTPLKVVTYLFKVLLTVRENSGD